MRNSVELGFEGGDGLKHFKDRYEKGFRVVSYAMSGAPAMHSFVMRQGTASSPDQKMSSRPRKGGTGSGSFYDSMLQQTAERFYPAYVGAYGDPAPNGSEHVDCRFSAIYEKLPANAELAPYMIAPAVWSRGDVDANDFVNALAEGEKLGYYPRSVGVLGVPTMTDLDPYGGHQGGPGLRFFATMWPRPKRGFGWAVHLTPNVANTLPGERVDTFGPYPWRNRWETQALSIQAYAVAGAVTRWRMGDVGPLSMTLSLWYDVRYKPWPEGDPFKLYYDGGSELSFEVIIADDLHVATKLHAAANDHDRLALSVGATKTSDRTFFFVPLGRPGSEEPIPRQLIISDPFNDPGGTVPLPGKGGSGNVPGGGVKIYTHLKGWLNELMMASGARHGQLVVVRRGALAHAAAHTWAEPGYAVCTLDHALRIGSVSKSLTAMMLFREVAAKLQNGLDTLILRPDLLDVSNGTPAPLLYLVNLLQLVSMNAGFITENSDPVFGRINMLSELTGEPRTAWQQAFDVVEPGTYSKFLEQHASNDYFEVNPGSTCHYPYSNESFLLLGELVSKFLTNSPANYADVSKQLLEVAGIAVGTRRHLLSRGWPAALDNGESPCQVRAPGHTWNRFRLPGTEDYICSPAYGPDGLHSAGAGGWCVPLVWFARILRGLCPLPNRKRYLTRAQLDQMAEYADVSCGVPQAHGCYRLPDATFTFRAEGQFQQRTWDVARIHHNGMIQGGTAIWAHQFPLDRRSGAQRDTLSFCLATNQDQTHALGATELGEIFTILQKMEDQNLFPSEDLFDVG